MATPTRLEAYIQPRASKTEVSGTHGGAIKIRIAAPAVENAANLALVEFLARRLGVAKSRIRIVSGSSSRSKRLEIDGVSAAAIGTALAPPG